MNLLMFLLLGVRSVSKLKERSADASAEKEPGRGVTSRVKVPEPATPEPSSRKMEITPSRVSPRKKEPEVPLKEAVKETAPRRPSQTRKNSSNYQNWEERRLLSQRKNPNPLRVRLLLRELQRPLKLHPQITASVTERLKKLKQEYIENVDDVEDLSKTALIHSRAQ